METVYIILFWYISTYVHSNAKEAGRVTIIYDNWYMYGVKIKKSFISVIQVYSKQLNFCLITMTKLKKINNLYSYTVLIIAEKNN